MRPGNLRGHFFHSSICPQKVHAVHLQLEIDFDKEEKLSAIDFSINLEINFPTKPTPSREGQGKPRVLRRDDRAEPINRVTGDKSQCQSTISTTKIVHNVWSSVRSAQGW